MEALTKRYRDGRIVVVHGGKTPDIKTPSMVVLEIKAKQKKDKTQFGFETARKNDPEQESGDPLKISSGIGELPLAA